MTAKSAKSSVQSSEPPNNDLVVNKVPPDGGWGWMIVISYAMANVITIPVLQSFGLIYKDDLADMGISATDASIIVNTFSAFGMSLGLINGPLLRKFGYRRIGVASGIFFSIGIMLTSSARSFTHFMITYSIIAAAGFGMATSAFSLALNTFFRKRRNKAVGFATTLTGLGPIFFPHLITVLLNNFGSSGCMLIIGAISLHILMAALLLQPIKWHLVDGEAPIKPPMEQELETIKETLHEESDSESRDGKQPELATAKDEFTAFLPDSPVPVENVYNFEFSSDEDEDDYLEMPLRRLSIAHDVDVQSIYGFEVTTGLSHPAVPALPIAAHSNQNLRSRLDLSLNRQLSLDNHAHNLHRPRRLSGSLPMPPSSPTSATPGKKRWFEVSRETVNLGSSISIFTERHENNRIIREPRKSIQFPAGALKVAEEGNRIVEKSCKVVATIPVKPTHSMGSYYENRPLRDKKSVSYQLRKFGRRVVKLFDLNLLRDPIYVNMMLGMSIAVFAEINFSLLTPFILSDMNYSTEQIASVMSALAITDIIFRFLAPYIGDLLKQPPRIMYMISLLSLIFARSLVYTATTYTFMMIVGLLLGMAKGVRTVYMSLVIPDYIPIDRLASASGIQMITNGFLLMSVGPLLGYIRDLTGSYQKCIIIINLVTMTTILMWTVEMVYLKYKKKS